MKCLLLILFLLEPLLSIQANQPYYYFKQLSIEEGLPSSITAIYDDEEGFLWIGTIYGVYRFDGEKLVKISFSNSPQTSSYVHNVLSDDEGNIWVFTDQGTGLYNKRQNAFDPFLQDEQPIRSYTVLSDGTSIILPIAGGLLRYDKQLKSHTKLTLKHSNSKTLLLNIKIYDTTHYIGLTNEHTLILINRTTGEVKDTPFNINNQVWDFYRDTKKRYWLSIYGKGIACYTHEGTLLDTYTPQNSTLNNTAILDIEERNGQIWLATDGGGINIIDPEIRKVTVLSNQGNQNFPANSVTCLNNGANNMWIGLVREGVLGAKENFITTYTKAPKNDPNGMSEKCPLCLIEDTDGTIWIGTDGGGVNSFNPQTEKFTHYPATAGEKIVSLCSYSKDELLISNFLTGTHIFNKKIGTYRKFTIVDQTTDSRIAGTSMPINLFINKKNEIEFHGKENYRYVKEKNQFTKFYAPQGRYRGPWIYIGTYQSKPYFQNNTCIFCYNYDANIVEPIYEPNGCGVIAACLDMTGKIWISNRYNMRSFDINSKKIEEVKLPDNNDLVTSLVADKQGTIWMGTPGALYAYSPHQNRFIIFSESDGVLPNDFLAKPVLITRNNNVYMGGAIGLVRVNKMLIQSANLKDQLQIKLLDVQLNGNSTIACYEQEVPSLEVQSNFTQLEVHTRLDGTDLFRKRIYRYLIEGLNDDYIESSKSYLRLQTLPPGKYQIHVQCILANGLWSNSFTMLQLTVLPPWWQRTWFVVIMGIVFLAGVGYWVRLREVQIQQKLKERERKIYKDKVQALININHELRTPLTLIYSPLKQLLDSKQIPYELRIKLQGVLKQTRQMKNIINMILNIRRMEVGQNKLCMTPTKLNEWINILIGDFKSEFEMRNLSLLFCPDSRIENISMDTNQCEIILNNLLMNAYKFNNQGSTITVSTTLEADGKFVRIAISDNGAGISEEELPKLFVRFQRGNHSIEGSGIGLSYAKQLVEMHGGTIEARNNEEQGVTFSFTLPVIQKLDETTNQDHQKQSKTTREEIPYLNNYLPILPITRQGEQTIQATKFHSILIVESDPDLRDYMASNLQSIFEKTFVAQDGMEALPVIVSQLPQLIISEVMLPRVSGLELCRKVKQNAETNFIPVILLAPDMDELNAEDGYKTGADAYLAKPFDMDLLIVQVQTILNNRSIMRKHYLATPDTDKAVCTKTNNHLEEQFAIHLNKVISENLSNTDLDVNMVAQLMRMSRASLYNKMKSTIGIGVNEYITKQRIIYAQQQLTTTNLTIREISESAGFLHPRNFSATFKGITGHSPSGYRTEFTTE